MTWKDWKISSVTVSGDSEGQRWIKPIKNILFAFPAEKTSDAERHIERAQPSKNVAKMRLNKGELREALKENIVLTMRGNRNNYLIHGKRQAFDEHHLFMHVGNKVVLAYRHGLLNAKKYLN